LACAIVAKLNTITNSKVTTYRNAIIFVHKQSFKVDKPLQLVYIGSITIGNLLCGHHNKLQL